MDVVTLSKGDLKFCFNSDTGYPIKLENSKMSIDNFDFSVEAGCDGVMKPGKLKFHCLDGLRTW